jgi:hypothetical protein
MSNHQLHDDRDITPERTLTRGIEAGAALYALDHASKGTPIGGEGDFAAQAARTGGNFVIVALLWHFLVVPYLVVTGVLFAIPTIVLAAIVDSHQAWGHDGVLVALVFAVSLILWIRYALYKWLWRKFIRPVDATLSGRVLDDPARQPQTRFRENPKEYLNQYNELSSNARERYLSGKQPEPADRIDQGAR